MTKEDLSWLRENVRIGYLPTHRAAWWYEGTEADNVSHFDGPVPMESVSELFDWEPVSEPLYVPSADGESFVPVHGRQAIMRSDNRHVMGVFKEGYEPHGYKEWLVDNVSTILDADLKIGSAGLLKGGAVAWVQVELNETMRTEGTDVEYKPFLLASTSLDGSLATQYAQKVQRVECDNTLDMALREKSGNKFKLKHTRNSVTNGKINEARDALGVIFAAAEEFEAQVKDMVETTVTDAEWFKFLDAYVPVPEKEGRGKTLAENKRESLLALWNNDERVSPYKGNLFGLYQCVNTYNQHIRSVKGGTRFERNQMNVLKGKVAEEDSEALSLMGEILATSA